MLATSLFSSSGSICGSPQRRAGFCRTQEGREGTWPGQAKELKEAPGPRLDGVGVHSDSNGYGSDIEEGVCSERRRGAKKPHHGLQVRHDITVRGLCERPRALLFGMS